ncbi:MAG TPA: thioredoxin family protein [archaeon]|nr:thioredoxin family protein [archaeon]
MAEKESDLLEFYGIECGHCNTMRPWIEKLEKEIGVKFTRIEVWHNEANAKRMQDIDQGRCGGVPYFYNKKSGMWICGAVSYDKLKAWAQGK